MKNVAIIADTHADESKRFDEHNRVMAWIAKDVAERNVDLVVHCGDIWERRSTSAERAAVGDWVRAVTEHCPLIAVAGNHDDPADVLWLSKLRTKHPVYAFDRPGVFSVEGVAIAALPWPRKGNLLAASSGGKEETSTLAIDLLRNVIRGLGAELDAYEGLPRLLACHVMIDGAKTDHEQPMVGADMAVSLADLALARCDFVACGHVHAQNSWSFGDSEIAYPGTPRCSNFGEPGPKGYIIVSMAQDTALWERVPTPATPMLLLEGSWNVATSTMDITSKVYPHADTVRGAECRFRFTVEADHREAAKRAATELKDRMLADGAVSCKLDEQVIAVTRARAPEISSAKTLSDKLAVLWTVRNDVPDAARRERLLAKLSLLEAEVA